MKVVLSDVHMGAGARPGMVNPYEDFFHDDRLAELIGFYASAGYAEHPVELVIAGDFLDLLKLSCEGRFVTDVTEDLAVDKVRRCIRGHPAVFDALAAFVRQPNHRITYLLGNHDPEVAFPRVQVLMRARLGLAADDPLLSFLVDEPFYRLPGGVVVTHGHAFEEMNRIDAGALFRTLPDGRRAVNLPYGSLAFMDVLAPVKAEQPLIDLVYPLSSFILWGLVFDLRFTMKVLWRMTRFFLKTRFSRENVKAIGFYKTLQILLEEVALFNNMERRAFRMLRAADDIQALVVGHSHDAKVRRFPRNKTYVNTGTWVKIVSLDLRNLGTRNYLTYALIEYAEAGLPAVRLMRWRGRPRALEEIMA